MKKFTIRSFHILDCQEIGLKYNKNQRLEQEEAYNVAMIGLMSDSHDNLTAIRLAVRLFNDAKCDLVIHAGDFVAPFAALSSQPQLPGQGGLRQLRRRGKRPYGRLRGDGRDHGAPSRLRFRRPELLVSHLGVPVPIRRTGPTFNVVVIGHTHKTQVRREHGVLIINPGEAGGWIHGKSTVALLDPKDLSVSIEIL